MCKQVSVFSDATKGHSHLHINSFWNHAFPTSCCFFTFLFEKASFWKHDKRTHPTQSHHISMHQRGDVTVLKSALHNVRLSLLFSADQRLSLGLPTNNHLAPSPRVIWSCLMKAKLSFYNTQPHRLFPSPHKNGSKYANICKHLKNLPQSHHGESWLAWAMIGGALASPRTSVALCLCPPVTALKGTSEKEFFKSKLISGQQASWL